MTHREPETARLANRSPRAGLAMIPLSAGRSGSLTTRLRGSAATSGRNALALPEHITGALQVRLIDAQLGARLGARKSQESVYASRASSIDARTVGQGPSPLCLMPDGIAEKHRYAGL